MKLRVREPFFPVVFFLVIFFFGGDIQIRFKEAADCYNLFYINIFVSKKATGGQASENKGNAERRSYFSLLST